MNRIEEYQYLWFFIVNETWYDCTDDDIAQLFGGVKFSPANSLN